MELSLSLNTDETRRGSSMKICSELCGVAGHLHDGATASYMMEQQLCARSRTSS